MSSKATFGSSMLFQTINDDLNSSLAMADELSREFDSLLQECKPNESTSQVPSQPSSSPSAKPQQTSTDTFSSRNFSNSSVSSSTDTELGGRGVGGSSIRSRESSSGSGGSTSLPQTPVSSVVLEPSQRSLEYLTSSSKNRSSSPVFSSQQYTPPTPRRERSSAFGQLTPPNQSPQMQRRPSPSPMITYDRGIRSSLSYSEALPSSPGLSYEPQSPRNTLHPLTNSLPPYDSSHMGHRLARSPSPQPLSQNRSSTLPRTFKTDEGMPKHRSPAQWNESDLDVSYERKPHPTYDKSDWLRPGLSSNNWKESNLDSPPSKKKDSSLPRQLTSQSATMPRNHRISVAPDQASHGHSQYSPQSIISRVSIPPTNSRARQHRPIPLSVIMRLQNPYYASAATRGPHTEPDMAQYRPAVPLAREYLPPPPPPEQRLPAYCGEVLNSGDVDAELEKIDSLKQPVTSEGPAPAEEAVPRPLSPTRLQPMVVVPEVLPNKEELLRIRSQIPRALKRRGSVDHSRPQKKAHGYQYKQMIDKLFHRKSGSQKSDLGSEASSGSSSDGEESPTAPSPQPSITNTQSPSDQKGYRSILRRNKQRKASGRRARLSPLVLLLDGSLLGELDTVQKAVQELSDPSQPNDEGMTALHNAICGGHYAVVEFLVRIGANISAPDSHGWTPLHCAASCNEKNLCEFLVRNGAAVMAVTESDGATAAQKCDPYAPGFEECESFLRGVEEAMGVENSGVLYALWSYPAQAPDELSFKEGDMVTILQKPEGVDWWWASLCGREGFVPNNYFGLFPKVRPKTLC
ncbi:relA-associated inhibitor isoform X2 [Chanos chanos]|uniref:RelA-associated inhibitor isoform X2 n=1 Tax=Chanos chanos TaxID=29144 RepID=A0A6J2UP91_CHACN|nr:relA-associated inhibitor isoform X2 [Chanos chanos]